MSWCGGGRDQPDAGRGVPGLGDPRVDLVPGQLAALARLGALRHLDLQVVGVDQVLAGDAEPAAGHLLDRGPRGCRRRRPGRSAPGPRRPRRCSTCAPSRFIAMASVSCASCEIEPYDIAPVENRLHDRRDRLDLVDRHRRRGRRRRTGTARAGSSAARPARRPARCTAGRRRTGPRGWRAAAGTRSPGRTGAARPRAATGTPRRRRGVRCAGEMPLGG